MAELTLNYFLQMLNIHNVQMVAIYRPEGAANIQFNLQRGYSNKWFKSVDELIHYLESGGLEHIFKVHDRVMQTDREDTRTMSTEEYYGTITETTSGGFVVLWDNGERHVESAQHLRPAAPVNLDNRRSPNKEGK